MKTPMLFSALTVSLLVGTSVCASEYTIYTFEVSAGEDTPHALSHVEFAFTEDGSEVMAPYGDTVGVKREHADGKVSGVGYVVVRDDSDVIKFEDATDGLGEDGYLETDTFLIYVRDSESPEVVVTTKASTGEISTTITVEEGASISDALGFTVTLVSITPQDDTVPLYD